MIVSGICVDCKNFVEMVSLHKEFIGGGDVEVTQIACAMGVQDNFYEAIKCSHFEKRNDG
jgi:hypothetical protein